MTSFHRLPLTSISCSSPKAWEDQKKSYDWVVIHHYVWVTFLPFGVSPATSSVFFYRPTGCKKTCLETFLSYLSFLFSTYLNLRISGSFFIRQTSLQFCWIIIFKDLIDKLALYINFFVDIFFSTFSTSFFHSILDSIIVLLFYKIDCNFGNNVVCIFELTVYYTLQLGGRMNPMENRACCWITLS